MNVACFAAIGTVIFSISAQANPFEPLAVTAVAVAGALPLWFVALHAQRYSSHRFLFSPWIAVLGTASNDYRSALLGGTSRHCRAAQQLSLCHCENAGSPTALPDSHTEIKTTELGNGPCLLLRSGKYGCGRFRRGSVRVPRDARHDNGHHCGLSRVPPSGHPLNARGALRDGSIDGGSCDARQRLVHRLRPCRHYHLDLPEPGEPKPQRGRVRAPGRNMAAANMRAAGVTSRFAARA